MVCRSKSRKKLRSQLCTSTPKKFSIRPKKKNQFYAHKSYKKCTQKTFKFSFKAYKPSTFCGRRIKCKNCNGSLILILSTRTMYVCLTFNKCTVVLCYQETYQLPDYGLPFYVKNEKRKLLQTNKGNRNYLRVLLSSPL